MKGILFFFFCICAVSERSLAERRSQQNERAYLLPRFLATLTARCSWRS